MGGGRDLWQQLQLAGHLHRTVLPQVERHVGGWWRRALAIPDRGLRVQALRSLRRKRFHCVGGSIYAAGAPDWAVPVLVDTICALQTLVDYLDNLADRTGTQTPANLHTLHLAVADALTPGCTPRSYYCHHPEQEDGGYLAALVTRCHRGLRRLPGYRGELMATCLRMGTVYSILQVLKHLPVAVRERELRRWLARIVPLYPDWTWWELAAACGSTLGIFALLRAAAEPDGEEWVPALTRAYFPGIGGLHILLDYYIDQAEDRTGGDLNFVSYYPDPARVAPRLAEIHDRCAELAGGLPRPALHRLVVAGLLGMYLSDPKVVPQRLGPPARHLIRRAGLLGMASYLYWRMRPPGR